MKSVAVLFIVLIALGVSYPCPAQSEKESSSTIVKEAGKVEVYYFHYTRRCATCNAVESVSKEAVSELYGDKVSFLDYNLDKKETKEISKELKVSGQTLLIVAGDTKINITSEGFMNARSNPNKLKAIIKEKIDPLL